VAYASSNQAPAKRIVITGGPGAGKTAILEVARRDLCKHVEVLPESARIAFSGGFPRRQDDAGLRGAQRAIFHLQHELERMGPESPTATTLLCDRGTLDGLAYWPGAWDEFFRDVGTTMQQELARYSVVIHLRVPGEIDTRLVEVWAAHPHRVFIDSSADFVRKAQRALAVIRTALTCCASKDPRHG
jgi:hypothetical protein